MQRCPTLVSQGAPECAITLPRWRVAPVCEALRPLVTATGSCQTSVSFVDALAQPAKATDGTEADGGLTVALKLVAAALQLDTADTRPTLLPLVTKEIKRVLSVARHLSNTFLN